jgi:hypothetical protein
MICIAALFLAQPARLDGILFGKPVVFDHAVVQKLSGRASAESNGKKEDEADVYVLTFMKGADMFYDQGIKFHLNVNPGMKLAKLSLTQPSVKFSTPEYSKVMHGHSKGSSCGRGAMVAFIRSAGKSESASDQLRFKFFCKPLANGEYKASIFAYASEFKSGVQGSFTFKLEKTQY